MFFRSRLLLTSLVWMVAALAGPDGFAQSRSSDEMFDPVAVVRGMVISRPACAELASQETAVWVEVGGKGECLRYYAWGLRRGPGPIPIVAAWLHGDILGRTGKNGDKHQKGLGVAAMIDQERRLSEKFGVPFIFLARPGAYGSSGKHYWIRQRQREADLVLAQLDALKSRYGIRGWALGGHSGGGFLAAAMLARRDDIQCAVLSSAPSAFRAFLEAHGYVKALHHPQNWFDPLSLVDEIPRQDDRRIFVIGDPRDTNVVFSTQQLYFEALKRRGHHAWLVPLERGPGPEHHSLVDFAETATGLCAAGRNAEAIVGALSALPTPAPRISN